MRASLMALFIMLVASQIGHAAQLRIVDMPNGGGRGILLSGVITPGDDVTFHALAATLDRAVVITTGPGGSVSPAWAIGSEIRSRGWSTLVPESAKCASACSMIWLAGQKRLLGADAQIGFHAMSQVENGGRKENHEGDVYLRQWLGYLGYALDATATIVNTPSSTVRWYDASELRANGIPTDPYP